MHPHHDDFFEKNLSVLLGLGIARGMHDEFAPLQRLPIGVGRGPNSSSIIAMMN